MKEKPIVYCGLCKEVFCVRRGSAGRDMIDGVNITPLTESIEECPTRQEIEDGGDWNKQYLQEEKYNPWDDPEDLTAYLEPYQND